MAFFDEALRGKIVIKRMVFHLIGSEEVGLVLLQETKPGKFADFFLERIWSVNGGTPYLFSDASSTRTRLARIVENGKLFQEESEKLAADFQEFHGGSTAPGAFLVFELEADGERCFALLKYDDETVLTYDLIEDEEGRQRVSLDAIERTFVQNREALQKSALIRLDDKAGELVVLDRRNQQKVARYFERFLDATRVHEDVDVTQKLVQLTRDLIRDNKDLVPPDVYRERTKRTYEAAAGGGKIDVDNHKMFLDTVVGRKLPDDSPLVSKFHNALKRARIDGTPITLNPAKVSKPATVRYITQNHIQIRVPDDMRNRITVEANRIIINDRLESQYDDPEPTH